MYVSEPGLLEAPGPPGEKVKEKKQTPFVRPIAVQINSNGSVVVYFSVFSPHSTVGV
jgi:hypothetical protein